MSKIEKIKKRDGRIVPFNPEKITNAIFKAAQSVGGKDRSIAEGLTKQVVDLLEKKIEPGEVPNVEQVQDIVEKVLIESGHAKTAKAYILYRQKRSQARKVKVALGITDELKLPTNTLLILASRYLMKDDKGKIIESTGQLFSRVAKTIANVENMYGKDKEEIKKLEDEFYRMMTSFEFLPNSPTLMNAGTGNNLNLSACFVIPVPDSMEGIFEAVKNMAMVQKAGGGCIEKGSRIFTTHCGIERIEDVYGNLSIGRTAVKGVDKEFIDVSNLNTLTPTFDKKSGKIKFGKIKKMWRYKVPRKKTIRIVTTGNYEATVSDWHPFFVFENGKIFEKKAGKLKVGDHILTSNSSLIESWPYQNYKKIYNFILDEKFGYIIGLFLTDGSVDKTRNGYRLRIFNSNKTIIDAVRKILTELTGINYSVQRDTRSKHTVYRISVYNKKLLEAVIKLNRGRIGKKEESIRVPEEIFKSPLDVIGAFLAGVVDGDGYISLNKRQIELSSASKEFIEDLSSLFYLLGVKSRFRKRRDKRNRKWKELYEISISDWNSFQLFSRIVAQHVFSKEKLRRLIEWAKIKYTSVSAPIVFETFEPFLLEAGVKVHSKEIWRKMIKINNKKFFLGRWRGRKGVSSKKLISLITELLASNKLSNSSKEELKLLKNVLPSLLRIKKIAKGVSEGEFYDLSVEGTNNYLAGKHGLAIIHNTGFSFSRLRPKGDIVKSTGGVASGPISFMKIFDVATEQIKQGGKRRGANMGILRVDHPDILDFIVCKEREGSLRNFNVSVAITDKFMDAIKNDKDFDLINPRTKQVVKTMKARAIWSLITTLAWKNGEPGIIFIDRINRHCNITPKLGQIEATNPCVAGDTILYTKKGLFRAEELHEKDLDPQVVIDGRLNKERFLDASRVFKTGKKTVFKLETKEGYELKLTPDHKVRTEDGWKKVKDLTPGDKLFILNKKGGFGKEGSHGLGMCLGWLIGDGTLSNERAILDFYGDEKKELAQKFALAVNKVVNGMQRLNRKYEVGVIDLGKKAEIKSARLKRIAKEMGLIGNKFQVPKDVFKGSEKMQKGFLQALFTADGSIQGMVEKGVSIRLAQSNLSLLKDVQKLLLNFGIASKIYEKRRPSHVKKMPDGKGGMKKYKCKAQHELVISRENLKTFRNEIGFLLKGKKEKLNNLLKKFIRGPYSEYFTVTFKKLEEVGKEIVYDIKEPKTHSFIANGIVVHNCGELPLLPYDSCNLGSINVSKMVKEVDGKYEIEWDKLRRTVRLGVRFLDNVIDANIYPIKQIEEMTKGNRKLGLGVMGWADMLILLGIPYNSEEALKLVEKVMKFITEEGRKMSVELGKEKGNFLNFKDSRWDEKGYKYMRNATISTIAPTGTISEIAGCSQAIEPLFTVGYLRNVSESLGTDLIIVNPYFEKAAIKSGFYNEAIMKKVLGSTSIQNIKEIPEDVRRVFVTAFDLKAEDHIKMQAAFQKYVDNSISKTINLPFESTPRDVEEAYILAYNLGCMGVTIYRHGSREIQVLKPLTTSPTFGCEACRM